MKHIPVWILLFISGLVMTGYAAEIPATISYPLVEGLTVSPDFEVIINGRNIPVEQLGAGGIENLNIVNFSCSGKQTVVIKTTDDIRNYRIRPNSRSISAEAKGKELTFTIDGSVKLYIEVNELPHLALIANPLEKDAPRADTKGITYFAPGIHNVGNLELQSGQHIYIAGGAVVNANIRGKDLQDLTISGRGNLNGNIRIDGTKNLQVEGIFIRNTQGWANTLTDCYQSGYENVKVFSYKGVWGLDGINPISCKDFTIRDCFIRTRDDCISIKSPLRKDDRNISTDGILIENCLLVGWDHADGVTLGFELQGGVVQNIVVKNCDITRAKGQGRTGGHSAFGIVCDGASQVSNVRFENIRVEEDIEYKNLEIILTEGERYGNGQIGSIKGVYLKDIHWENPRKPFVIAGVPSVLVEDITFHNCYVAGKLLTSLDDADFQTEFAKEIRFIPGGDHIRERYPQEGVDKRSHIPGLRPQEK